MLSCSQQSADSLEAVGEVWELSVLGEETSPAAQAGTVRPEVPGADAAASFHLLLTLCFQLSQ